MSAPQVALARASAPAREWSLRTCFALAVAAQVLLFSGSNLPTPLFPIYEQQYGFGSGTVTLLFGSYVAVLIPALLFVGPLTDRVGRRPLLVSGIAITVLSSFAFALARNLGWLYAGEVIYGVASALVMSCVSITIRELHPRAHVASAALAASVAMAAGLTLGPLVSGFLAWATPWRTTAPYVLDIVLASLLAFALTRIPETRPAPTGTARQPIISVPADIRARFIAPAAAGAASFMAGGWVFALSPSFLHESLGIHITQPIVAGLFAALVLLVNGASQIALRNLHSRVATSVALVMVSVGMAVIAVSAASASLAVAIVGALVVGVGSGIAQMNAMHSVQHLVPMHARGAVMSTYITVCYVALSAPVIVAGFAADRYGLTAVTAWYTVALTIVVAAAVLLTWTTEPVAALSVAV